MHTHVHVQVDTCYHLGDEVVVEEDVGWSGQHGVGGGVPGSGLQEGVGREAGHRGGVELRLQVHQSHRHLRGPRGRT